TWGAPKWPPTPANVRSAPGNPWHSSIARLAHRREPQPGLLPYDHARPREMGGQDQRAGIGVALDELAPRLGRLRAVVAEAARPLRLGHLHHAVHEIAGEHRGARARRQPYRDVARCVADRRLEAKPGIDLGRVADERRLTGGHDRQHAGVDAAVLVAAALVLVLPERPLLAREHVARVGKGRHLRAV